MDILNIKYPIDSGKGFIIKPNDQDINLKEWMDIYSKTGVLISDAFGDNKWGFVSFTPSPFDPTNPLAI